MIGRSKLELDAYGAAMFLDPVKTPEDELISRDEVACIGAELEKLPARVERAIRMYYGIGEYEPHTLDGVGAEFGVTRERVRQIILGGQRKLTQNLKRKLRPEMYLAERNESIRQLRADQARSSELKAKWKTEDDERAAEAAEFEKQLNEKRRGHRTALELFLEGRRRKERDDALLQKVSNAVPAYDPWVSLEANGLYLTHYEPSQIADMKQRLRSMKPAMIARLKDYVIANNMDLMMKTFGPELNGDD